jgi:hypothetical protein
MALDPVPAAPVAELGLCRPAEARDSAASTSVHHLKRVSKRNGKEGKVKS